MYLLYIVKLAKVPSDIGFVTGKILNIHEACVTVCIHTYVRTYVRTFVCIVCAYVCIIYRYKYTCGLVEMHL